MYKKIELFMNKLIKLNVNNKIIDKFSFNCIYLFIFLLLIPFFIFNLIPDSHILDIYKNIDYIFIPLFLYVFIHNIKNKRINYSIDFILLSLFLIISFISCITSINFFVAFIGSTLRSYGFITYIVLYLLYVNIKEIVSKEVLTKFIDLFFFIGIIQVVFALGESYLNGQIILFPKYWHHMATGLCSNPNMFGTYCMFLCLLSLLLSLFYDGTNRYYKITSVIMFIGLILSCSTGPFLSFCLMLIIILIYNKLKKKGKYNNIIIWLSILVSLYVVINYSNIYINKNVYKYEIMDNETISGDIKILTQEVINKTSRLICGHEILNITKIKDDEIGSGRIRVWKETIKYIGRDNHIWFGSGPDSLNILYYPGVVTSETLDSVDLIRIDKAHNDYLNVLATTGIFSFIIYLLWTYTIHKNTINSDSVLINVLFLSFIGYNIQSLLNINVIEVMPYYLIVCGIMMGMVNKNEKNSMQKC